MNPLIFRKGVCDPHIHIFEGRAYLYATHDAPGFTEGFCMQDWQIWSSVNLIDWELETMIFPEGFYCGSMDQCWAVDAAYKDGKYYLYFSTGDWGVGVAVSDSPRGPFRDALGHAIADYRTYPENIQKWDPHIFQDDDGETYLIVGTCLQEKPWDCYLIARLEADMIHLAEPFRRIEYFENPCPEDKPSIHKYNGIYYLTHASYYAISDSVYGPYTHKGHIGFTNDHGAFFTYNNQTYFAAGGMDNANRYFRSSFLTPCHYRMDGTIFIDQKIVSYGCGQYDATWEKIQARWYFAASRECKSETKDGDIVTELRDGDYLYFPEILNVEENTQLRIDAVCEKTAKILILEDSLEGKVLGSCILKKSADGKNYWNICSLQCSAGKKSLYFKIMGEAQIRGFSFDNGKKRCTAQPVFSKRGRGASLEVNKTGANHRVLTNLELRGAGMDVYVDGGTGGRGRLTVNYWCEKANARMYLYINGEKQRELEFSVTGDSEASMLVQKSVDVNVDAGLNKIGLWTEEYQEGKMKISHLTLETEKSCCKVYSVAEGKIFPEGNGCWDGLPQWETEPQTYSGRIVKYLGKVGHGVEISQVDGGKGGAFDMEIYYCCGEKSGSLYELHINEKFCATVLFSYTGGYLPDNMKNYRVSVVLEKGRHNKILLKKIEKDDNGIFIDTFSLIPAIMS